ncbi:hypothetical protein RF11_04027 [Thelohanellus kitauei]|uniref:MD-2-related lipid-recognition domain-containing protein n=1 Tax=Thelohanellus kitauei TaxID=669202 RepID=A0A0C2J0B4_THEKT|nr:hypothetical protein RF11_04027 [Thelohanellus kitauei]
MSIIFLSSIDTDDLSVKLLLDHTIKITVPGIKRNACEYTKDMCPVKKNTLKTLVVLIKVPKYLPLGYYFVQVELNCKKGHLTCFYVMFEIDNTDERYEAVGESFVDHWYRKLLPFV